MAQATEYAVFGALMALNFGIGLYFSLRRKARSADTTAEVFLGSRALRSFPLAASVVASLISSTGLVGFTGHFYAYGFHLMWNGLNTIAVAPLVACLFLPVFYALRITSVFEYIRLRFNSAISLTACGSYLFLTQSIGALSIYAASLTIVTIFGAPLIWCNIVIGVCGTLYTALGGLRGVVWTDCMQLVFILLGPTTVIAKIIVDSASSRGASQALHELDLRTYVANVAFDITHDENVWSAFVASTTASIYRVGLDQVVVQRCMASRTLGSAQRTVLMGSLMLVAVYATNLAVTVALIVWFWGCDPKLSGAINSYDQILPYYVKTFLVNIPGFTGLFLAAVVSAATSTISSIINSQAAVLYVDVLSPNIKGVNSHVKWITRGTAFLLGAMMTLYSCVCVYMGSITRVIMMVLSASTGPFVGLLLLAIAFPFVHTKGAGISTLLLLGFQLLVMWQAIYTGAKPPLMPVTLDYCPENSTDVQSSSNFTTLPPIARTHTSDSFHLSPFWSCLFSTCGTVVLGVLISVATGEHKQRKAEVAHVNKWFVHLWRKLGFVEYDMKELNGAKEKDADQTTTALLLNRDAHKPETTI
ncbi:sodium-coupled monocarboxylate transporter 2-like [Dermacentor andersoni]|uniref:sodium-coupled monocarboxylate transporter 2-like n=1 Tax=Dermacentor andersoni TaxID=34620 RepID=UPI002417F61B|nr:sodium-coupled monocarboxylate transporter 2-like [Dermacentor andersoni]